MDEKEQEFSLEDIMREFGTEPMEQPEQQSPVESVQEPEDAPEMQAEESGTADEATAESVQVTGDTIRLDDLADAVPQTANIPAQPLEEETEEPTVEGQTEEETVEPYSEGWEPEYEQPMADYVPPEPIVFRPRSRLRELKRKLIAGPEKRYYELSEGGTGKTQAAIFVSILVSLLSIGATAMYALDMVQENRLQLMVFSQFFAMLLSALLGSFQLIEGVTDLFKGRFTLKALMVFTFIACCVDGVFGLQERRVPCCAAFCLEVTMALWNTYEKHTIEMGQMDTMRKAVRLDSLVPEGDCFDGRTGILRGEGQVEDFMETFDAPTGPDKILSGYGLVALLLSVVGGVLAGVMHSVSFGFQVAAISLLAAVPATAHITTSRPMAVLERRLHRLGTVLCGWQGVQALSGKVVFPLTHDDLFPVGSAKMNGVKFYGSRDPDQVVEYSTALIEADGGGLVPLFRRLLDSRNGRHYDVENLRPYGSGGIGGEVCGEAVLVGTSSFLQDMGVEIPDGIRVDQAVYVAIDGSLSGLFAITYSRTRNAAAGLSTLCSYRGVEPVLVSGDFMLTEDFIRSKFGVNTRRMAFPERQTRAELSIKEPEPGTQAAALTTQDGLAPMAYAITGARSLRGATTAGVVIHILGGSVGLAMMLVLAYLGAAELLTPANVLLYQLLWMIPGLLITEWTRTV